MATRKKSYSHSVFGAVPGAAGSVLFACLFTAQAHAAGWESLKRLNVARDQFAAGVVGDSLYVFGGNGDPGGTNLNSLEVFNTSIGTWSVGPANSLGVEELTGAGLGGAFYAFGAWNGNPGVFNYNEKFTPGTGTWQSLSDKPTTVTAAPAVVYGDEIFLFGGSFVMSVMHPSVPYDVVEAYHPGTNAWRTVTTMPDTISNMAVAAYEDTVYLIGGVVHTGDSVSGVQLDVLAYHVPSDTWTTTGLGSLPSVRAFGYSTAAPVVNGKIYLVGGIRLIDPNGPVEEPNFVTTAEVLIYDIATQQFMQGVSLPEAREDHAVLAHDGWLYAIGGETPGGRSADTLRLQLTDSQKPEKVFLRGDCNDDGEVDISDAVFSLGSLFLGEGTPGCDDACDSNDDGAVDISDAIATLGVLFLGNGTIPFPGMEECGVDPTEEQPIELGCEEYESCPEG